MNDLAKQINRRTAEIAVLIEMRNEKIWQEREAGAKLKPLALEWDLTPQRIHAIYRHMKKVYEAQPGA